VLLVNRELGVTDNVEKEHMRDFEFDLFGNFGSHMDSHGNARRNDTLKYAAKSREESGSAMPMRINRTRSTDLPSYAAWD